MEPILRGPAKITIECGDYRFELEGDLDELNYKPSELHNCNDDIFYQPNAYVHPFERMYSINLRNPKGILRQFKWTVPIATKPRIEE